MSKKRKKAIPPVMTLKVGPDRYEVFTGKDVKNDGCRVMGLCFYGQSRIVVSTEYSRNPNSAEPSSTRRCTR
jgi:hypothetical protein